MVFNLFKCSYNIYIDFSIFFINIQFKIQHFLIDFNIQTIYFYYIVNVFI